MSKPPGSLRSSSTGRALVQQGVDAQRAVGGDQVEVGHPASEQRVPHVDVGGAEVVLNDQAGHRRGESRARLVRREELGNGLPQRRRALVCAAKRDERHRGAQHAGSDRVALGVVGVQEAFRRGPVDHLGQLPAQVHRILDAGVEALAPVRGMHVCGVAGQQGPSRRGSAEACRVMSVNLEIEVGLWTP